MRKIRRREKDHAGHQGGETPRTADGGRLRLNLALTKNEVTLVEIVPVRAETATYIGLDDRKIPSYG